MKVQPDVSASRAQGRMLLPARHTSFQRACLARISGRHVTTPVVGTAAIGAQDKGLAQSSNPATTAEKRAGKALWGKSQHVQLVGVEEAEELYLSLVQRTNEQHVLMVLHAPWCPHSQAAEQEIETLARGLSHLQDLSIVALNVDPPAARYFSKEVLGVNALPSFVLFPRESRTFYKYKGKGRDAQSLLKFLNMVCNQSTDQVWQLGAPSITTIHPRDLAAATTSPLHLAHFRREVDANAGLLAGAIALAAAAVLAKFFTNRKEHQKHMDVILAGQKSPPAGPGATTDEDNGNTGGDVITSTRQLNKRIDSVMGRMGGLMVRLAGARVSLGVIEAQAVVGGVVAGGQTTTAIAPSGRQLPLLPAAVDATINVQAEPVIASPALATADVDSATTEVSPALGADASISSGAPTPVPAATAATAGPESAPAPALAEQPQVAEAATSSQAAALDVLQQGSGLTPPPSGRAVVAAASVISTQKVPTPVARPLPPPALMWTELTLPIPTPEPLTMTGEQLMTTPLPGQATEAVYTGEQLQLPEGALSTAELLQLLDEEGNDVDRVVQRLLSSNLPLESGKA